MKRIFILLAFMLIFAVLAAGCSSYGDANAPMDGEGAPDNSVDDGGGTEAGNGETDNREPGNGDTDNSSGSDTADDLLIESGRYQGREDSNFIEIKISGVPDELSTRVYMLSEEIKEGFDQYNLQQDDNIKFEYYVNENSQMVIVSITKI